MSPGKKGRSVARVLVALAIATAAMVAGAVVAGGGEVAHVADVIWASVDH